MNKHISRIRRRNQRGNTLVEAGLIFVLGISLLIGLFDLGQILFIHQTVVERTRAAARWAAVNPYNSDQTKNMVLYGSPTAPDGGTPLFGMTTSNIAVAHDNSDGLYADRIQITVSGYTYFFFSAAIVNTMYPSAGHSGSVSPTHTGLTISMTIPHETVN
jgi:Flp pilus assembly protein TadG